MYLNHNQNSFSFSDLQLTDQQRYNICLAYIEDKLLSSSRSLKYIVNMPYPAAEFTLDGYNRLIYDELDYNIPDLIIQHQALHASLTNEQKGVYQTIVTACNNNKGGMFFVYGYGGTGKTFLYKTLTVAIRSKGQIVLNVASSGIAFLLLDGGRTAHSGFAIPINIVEDSMCIIIADSDLADLIRQTKLIIWDEAPMINRLAFEAFDRTLRDITGDNDSVFGGKVVVFGGDFRQILPVIPNGSRQDVVHASLNMSYLWKHCTVLKLTKNMRLRVGCDPAAAEEINEFADWILKIGEGKIGGKNDGHAEVVFPEDMLIPDSDDHVGAVIKETYDNWEENKWDPTYYQDRAILAPTHKEVDKINDRDDVDAYWNREGVL